MNQHNRTKERQVRGFMPTFIASKVTGKRRLTDREIVGLPEPYLFFCAALHFAQRARWAAAILFFAADDMGLRFPDVVPLPTALEPAVPTSLKTFRAVFS